MRHKTKKLGSKSEGCPLKMLMSIKSVFADKIMGGIKIYEHRQTIPKQAVSGVIVHSSSPVQCIISEFQIADIVCGNLAEVWEKTRHYSGIAKEFYLSYFTDKSTANTIQVTNVKRYRDPADPYDIIPGFRAPQSFSYLDGATYSLLTKGAI